jgi:hypothetical protein|tara:strand:- start:1212 stop:1358 length:147 start_codon:yes stop_codon:yes gene_type:complete
MTGSEDLLRVRQYSIDSLQSELKKAYEQISFLEAQLDVVSKDLEQFIS